MAVSHTGQYRLGAMSSLLHSTPTMMSDTYLAVSHIVNHLQEIIMSPLPTSGNCIPVPGVSSKGRSKGRSQLQGKVQGPLGEDKVQRCARDSAVIVVVMAVTLLSYVLPPPTTARSE